VQNYHQYTAAQDIEKELHSLLISADVGLYVEWLRKVGRGFKDLADNTLRRLYNALVDQYRPAQLKELLAFCRTRDFDPSYRSIDALLSDVDRDSPLKGLEQRVNQKIELILDILAVQLQFNQKNEAEDNVVLYTLGDWFEKLAHLALDRQVSRGKFQALFEELFMRHCDYIKFDHLHQSGLFLNVIERFYFGSHVGTGKLLALFKDVIHNQAYEEYMVRLKQKLVAYKVRTGKFAFPNAKNLLGQF
jgi:hypothetical protein